MKSQVLTNNVDKTEINLALGVSEYCNQERVSGELENNHIEP